METLSSRLQAKARKQGGRPAIIEDGCMVTYSGLLEEVGSLVDALDRFGVSRGSRVALVLPNGSIFVKSFFAVAHLGGIVLPLNPGLQEPELAFIMDDARVSIVLTTREDYNRCSSALRSPATVTKQSVIAVDECGHKTGVEGKSMSPTSAVPGDPVLHLYSSGSTGRPKRVERSHFNLIFETNQLIAALGLSPSDRVLGVVPFSHINGLMRSMVASVLSGATLVPLRQFERRAVARSIQEYGITVFIGVPFMFAMLAETRWPGSVDFSSLRLSISSSAPLPPRISQCFYERYGVRVRQLYGTTETGTISVNLDPDPDESSDSVGTPLHGVAVEIFAEKNRHPLLPGEIGEIGIRSPAAAQEYLGLPDQTKSAFWNGYFFPGDVGRKDSEGRIYIAGRKSLFINRGGYKVNPYEIEDLIQRHPKVREVVVVGVDTEYGDQKIKAVIVPKGPCDEGDIIESCREKISDFKIPSIVEFRPVLPKTSTGKILRNAV